MYEIRANTFLEETFMCSKFSCVRSSHGLLSVKISSIFTKCHMIDKVLTLQETIHRALHPGHDYWTSGAKPPAACEEELAAMNVGSNCNVLAAIVHTEVVSVSVIVQASLLKFVEKKINFSK